jgi:hypothetical protein
MPEFQHIIAGWMASSHPLAVGHWNGPVSNHRNPVQKLNRALPPGRRRRAHSVLAGESSAPEASLIALPNARPQRRDIKRGCPALVRDRGHAWPIPARVAAPGARRPPLPHVPRRRQPVSARAAAGLGSRSHLRSSAHRRDCNRRGRPLVASVPQRQPGAGAGLQCALRSTAFQRWSRPTVRQLRGSSGQKRANCPWQARTPAAMRSESPSASRSRTEGGNCQNSVPKLCPLTIPVFLDRHYQSGPEGIQPSGGDYESKDVWARWRTSAPDRSCPCPNLWLHHYRRDRRRRNPRRRRR